MSKSKKKISVKGLELSASADLSQVIDKTVSSTTKTNLQSLVSDIENASKDLFYTSETEAKILLFVGSQADAVTKENLLIQTKNESNPKVEEKDFTDFFDQLTKIQDWFGNEEKEIAAKYSGLSDLLKNNLKDLKVFKVGKINLDIYVVGLDTEGVLTGVQTKAVET